MSVKIEAYDSLPYIDADITETEREKATRRLMKEIPSDSSQQLHPSIQQLPESKFSSLMQKHIVQIASKKPAKGGIDLSRYEAPDEPGRDANVQEWRQALINAYTSSTYLSGRRTNLTLLEELGKNAWLIGNHELDGTLKRLEKELADIKAEVNEVNKGRKALQVGSQGELLALEDTWKKGIAKIVDVQVARVQLQEELREKRAKTVA